MTNSPTHMKTDTESWEERYDKLPESDMTTKEFIATELTKARGEGYKTCLEERRLGYDPRVVKSESRKIVINDVLKIIDLKINALGPHYRDQNSLLEMLLGIKNELKNINYE